MPGMISRNVVAWLQERETSPARYCFIVIAAIFISETVVTVALRLFLPPQPLILEATIGGVLLTFILFPFLHVFVLPRLLRTIIEPRLTEKHLAECDLRDTKVRYQSLVEFSPYGIAIHDGERFLFINSAGATMVGAEGQDEVIGRNVADFIHPDEQEAAKTYVEEILNHDSVFPKLQMKVVRLDGKVVDVEMAAMPFTSKNERAVYLIANDVSERKRAEEQLRLSLLEKEVLVKELHHRVKNNLQVVYALLGLQAKYLKDECDVGMFIASLNRIRTMALIHEELYLSENLAQIDFASYIRRFSAHLFESYGADSRSVEVKTTAGTCMLDIDMAVPCGLIINELVGNSLKHAFPDPIATSASVCIQLDKESGQFVLRVSDNGIGLPEEIDLEHATTLGFRLVKILANQMGAVIDVKRGLGTEFIISFNASRNGE